MLLDCYIFMSTSFKLLLELNKTNFVLFYSKHILSLLSTNQSQILLKSLVSDTFMLEEQE